MLITVLILVLVSVFILIKPHKVEMTNEGPIVGLGASLIAGYGVNESERFMNLVGNELDQDVLNLGVSGDTSAQILNRLNLVPPDASIVVVSAGGNDIIKRLPIADTRQNLMLITERLSANGSIVLLLDVRGPLLFGDYKSFYRDVASQNDRVILVSNIFDGIITDPSLMIDTIHPNAAGHQLFADRILTVINNQISFIE